MFQSFYNKGLTDLFNYKIIPAETKLRKNLIRIRKGECLNLEEINEIINIFEYFEKTYPELPHELLPIASELIKKTFQKLNKELKKEFRAFVSPHGEIEYNKHPILKELFQNIEDLEKAIRITITQMINSTELNESLQFNTYDSINDRFVLPIMSSRYKPSFGQIVSRSETGQTLYVEPFQIKNMVDKRIAAIMTLEDTIYKIYEEYLLLDFWVNLIFEIDYYIGHIKFSQKYNLNKANISKTPVIKITNFFHPLIDNCVKNSLQLNDTHDGIIISGPNTGGKTIALKSTLI